MQAQRSVKHVLQNSMDRTANQKLIFYKAKQKNMRVNCHMLRKMSRLEINFFLILLFITKFILDGI